MRYLELKQYLLNGRMQRLLVFIKEKMIKKMENKIGITLASNIEKHFERIINNGIIEELPFTEGHSGGRKAYSSVD